MRVLIARGWANRSSGKAWDDSSREGRTVVGQSISPERSSMNSSRSASSLSDQDAGRVAWVSASEKSYFLELNRHRAAVLFLRPLELGVCQLGDFTGRFLPRDGRTGPKLIAESRVKTRSTSAGHSAIMYEVTIL